MNNKVSNFNTDNVYYGKRIYKYLWKRGIKCKLTCFQSYREMYLDIVDDDIVYENVLIENINDILFLDRSSNWNDPPKLMIRLIIHKSLMETPLMIQYNYGKYIF